MAAVQTAMAAVQKAVMAATAVVPVAQPTLDTHVTAAPHREGARDSTARLGGTKIQLTILL